jgi:hypothetical protein
MKAVDTGTVVDRGARPGKVVMGESTKYHITGHQNDSEGVSDMISETVGPVVESLGGGKTR